MRRYTINHLRYFTKAATYENIAKAADSLGVSPSSVSKAVSQLEKELGVTLFVRHLPHGLTLTENGKRIQRKVGEIFNKIDQLDEAAAEISTTTCRVISIGCIITLAQTIFPSLRRNYEATHPNVQIRHFELNQDEIIEHIRQERINVALTYDLAVPADLKFLPLVDLPPHIVVSENHELAGKSEVLIEELQEYPMILLDQPHVAEYAQSLFKEISATANIVDTTKDPTVRLGMVANEFGFSIVNFTPALNKWPNREELKFIPIADPVRILKMGLMTSNVESRSELLQSFIDYCLQF